MQPLGSWKPSALVPGSVLATAGLRKQPPLAMADAEGGSCSPVAGEGYAIAQVRQVTSSGSLGATSSVFASF